MSFATVASDLSHKQIHLDSHVCQTEVVKKKRLKNQRGPSVEEPLLTKSPDSLHSFSSVAKPKPIPLYGVLSLKVTIEEKKNRKISQITDNQFFKFLFIFDHFLVLHTNTLFVELFEQFGGKLWAQL